MKNINKFFLIIIVVCNLSIYSAEVGGASAQQNSNNKLIRKAGEIHNSIFGTMAMIVAKISPALNAYEENPSQENIIEIEKLVDRFRRARKKQYLSDVASVQNETVGLKKEIADLKKKIADLTHSNGLLSNSIQNQFNENRKLKKELSAAEASILSFEQARAQLNAGREKSKAKLTIAKKTIEALQKKLSDSDRALLESIALVEELSAKLP